MTNPPTPSDPSPNEPTLGGDVIMPHLRDHTGQPAYDPAGTTAPTKGPIPASAQPSPTPKFPYNPAHPCGTCADCGEEMVHNVPRMGPNGGFIHKASGQPQCGERADTKLIVWGGQVTVAQPSPTARTVSELKRDSIDYVGLQVFTQASAEDCQEKGDLKAAKIFGDLNSLACNASKQDAQMDQLILERDMAEDFADKITSEILSEDIDWPDHTAKWEEAFEEVVNLQASIKAPKIMPYHRRCAITGFMIDIRFAAEKPSIAFEMRGRTKPEPGIRPDIEDCNIAGPGRYNPIGERAR